MEVPGPAADRCGRPRGDVAGGQYAVVRDATGGGESGIELADGEAPGDESDGELQGHGDDGGAERCGFARVYMGGVCVDRKHERGDGGVCGASWTAEPGADPRGQDCVGEAVAVDGLRRDDGTAEDGLRWLSEGAERDCEARAGVPAELGEPVQAGRAEDAGVRDPGAVGMAGAAASDCAGREPGEQLGIG